MGGGRGLGLGGGGSNRTRRWGWRWGTAGEDDEAALVPFHFPVGGDGDFGRDEGVVEARVEDG